MSDGEVKKCLKCGGEMVEADRLVAHTRLLAGITLAKKGDIVGDEIVPYYCRNCGYIELYKKIKAGERGRGDSSLKKCIKCGRKIPIASEECPHCGTKQTEYVKS